MKIKNYGGRSWISKFLTNYPRHAELTIHIINAEVEEAELKGNQLIIRVVTKQRGEPG